MRICKLRFCVRALCWLLSALVALFPLMVIEVWAADAESLLPVCSACHGGNGIPPGAEIPIIAGQPFTMIEDALMLFADGQRPCTVMCGVASALSPREKEALAEYFEQQPFVPADQEYDPALASMGEQVHTAQGCETCHSRGGRDGHGIAPILAGQHTPYLRDALLQIQAGKRRGPKVMNQAVQALSNGEIEALLNFYARNQEKPDCHQQGTASEKPPGCNG